MRWIRDRALTLVLMACFFLLLAGQHAVDDVKTLSHGDHSPNLLGNAVQYGGGGPGNIGLGLFIARYCKE